MKTSSIIFLVLIILGVLVPGAWIVSMYFLPKKDSGYNPLKRANDNFPLKKGSQGANVEKLQQFLKDTYKNLFPNKTAFPKYGIDGSWGRETQSVIEELAFPNKITETWFNKNVK